MKQTKTEQRIRRAMEHAAPPMDDILSAAAQRKEAVLSMEQYNKKKRTTPNTRRSSYQKRRKNRNLAIVSTILASAAAFVFLFAGVTLFQRTNAVQARITLDVNPSIGISVNSKERVLDVSANNAAAQDVIGTMDFAGTQLEVTVNALVGSMLQKGYLDAHSNAILVSVEDSDAQHALDLQSRISATINGAFGSGEAAVLTQTLPANEAPAADAQQYGISEGKAALIRSLVAQDETLTFEALAPLGVQEIALIAESRNLHAEGVRQSGTTADGGYIGRTAAEEFALKHAGVSADAVTGPYTELDSENGTMVYEIEFYLDGVEYDYEINAVTGEVRKAKTEGKKTAPAESTKPEADIGEAKAKQIALDHAGLKESAVEGLSVKLDRDDGRYEYDVKFYADSVEYDFEIDAASGEIRKAETETKKAAAGSASSSGASASESASSSNKSSDSSADADIGKEKAKLIALDHAGLSESAVSGLKVERDRDDGRIEYEVEFRHDGMEYDYEIDGATGKIRKAEKDRD